MCSLLVAAERATLRATLRVQLYYYALGFIPVHSGPLRSRFFGSLYGLGIPTILL